MSRSHDYCRCGHSKDAHAVGGIDSPRAFTSCTASGLTWGGELICECVVYRFDQAKTEAKRAQQS